MRRFSALAGVLWMTACDSSAPRASAKQEPQAYVRAEEPFVVHPTLLSDALGGADLGADAGARRQK